MGSSILSFILAHAGRDLYLSGLCRKLALIISISKLFCVFINHVVVLNTLLDIDGYLPTCWCAHVLDIDGYLPMCWCAHVLVNIYIWHQSWARATAYWCLQVSAKISYSHHS